MIVSEECQKVSNSVELYHLQFNPEIPHKLIDKVRQTGYEIQESVEATSWIDAKRKLGYPLTYEQELRETRL